MAYVPTNTNQLRKIAKDLGEAAGRLHSVCDLMSEHPFDVVFLQVTSAERFAKAIVAFARDAEMHLSDQIHCAEYGGEPLYQTTQRRSILNKERKKASTALTSEGLVKPKKKAAKKKGES